MNLFRLMKQVSSLYNLRALHLSSLAIGNARRVKPRFLPTSLISGQVKVYRRLTSRPLQSTLRPTNDASDRLSNLTDVMPVKDSDSLWKAYEEAMRDVVAEFPVGRPKKVSPEAFLEVKSFLLSASENAQNMPVKGESSKTENTRLRKMLDTRKTEFLHRTNFTSPQYEAAVRCLANLASYCAKKKIVAPVVIAWQKIKESGTVLKPNLLSTFIYVLGLDEHFSDIALEVATVHDILFGSTENSVFFRIKALVSMRDPSGAEALLGELPDVNEECKRLRTFSPILNYYCDTGDAYSILRVWKQIREAPGAHLDSITYAVILGTLARQKAFQVDAKKIEGTETLGMSCGGPDLLDEILCCMRKDIVELSEEAAVMICNDFQAAFVTTGAHRPHHEVPLYSDTCIENRSENAHLLMGRVTIEPSTARCTCTGTKLRLFTLNSDQRRHLNNTLLEMAATQQMDFGARSKKESKYRSGQQAQKELRKFGKWLENRDGAPYTAFVDGANVAYFGQGTVRYSQVLQVVNELEKMGERPLVIMPRKYVNPSFRLGHGVVQELTQQSLDVVTMLINDKKMYVVPAYCFDDYYWMLASVSKQKGALVGVPCSDSKEMTGVRPILISNDQMRDHKLSMLEPLLFRRWYSSHVTTYTISPFEENEWEDRVVRFFPADSFSFEIQGNEIDKEGMSGTAWHFPVSEWENRKERFCLAIGRSSKIGMDNTKRCD